MIEGTGSDPKHPAGDADGGSHTQEGRSLSPEERAGDPNPPHDPSRHTNPPRTTQGWFTAPEFGAAGSGGAEYEQGHETD